MSWTTERMVASAALALALTLTFGHAAGATIELFPATAGTDEEFERVANTLGAGDTLVLHGGSYSQTGRRAVTVNGTASAPIVIRAAAGELPVLTRPADNINTQNNIEIVSSSHLILRGVAFRGGSTGVRFIGGHHITLEDCEIAQTGNNAVAMNSGSSDAMVFRRNHVHHTGLLTTSTTEGEGFYVGCNNNACRVTNSLFEGNYIHHLRGTSAGGNDGIEVKVGSYGNIIRNNVIHDTNIGSDFPGIFVYGGGADINVVEGNVMWNCGEAIQVVSDAIVRNNIILSSSIAGITAAPHSQVAQMKNVTITNNTIYGNPDGIYVRWSTATNMILANNAIYSPGAVAVDGSGLSGSTVTVSSNFVEGALQGASLDGVKFRSGGTAAAAFLNPAARDLWPTSTSVLRGGAAVAYMPPLDFNETTRTVPADAGAYETEGLNSNPGWTIVPGFKSLTQQGDVTPPAAIVDLRSR